MICPKCKSRVPDNAEFCPICGYIFKPQDQPKPAAPANCPTCGMPLKPGKPYCRHCGTRL